MVAPPRSPNTSRSLAIAGAHVSRTAAATPLSPGAGASMHESCLRNKSERAPPAMRSIARLQEALERDAATQERKYGGANPSVRAARFHVDLPRGPQHLKFSARPEARQAVKEQQGGALSDEGETSDQDEGLGGGVEETVDLGASSMSQRFNISTLRSWFKDIDVKQTGSISQRELIIALRQHRGMQALFCTVSGLDFTDATPCMRPEELAAARRQEVQRIKRILDEIDTDGSGSMEWAEFVEFFKRAGLFLEYQTRASLNRSSACTAAPLTLPDTPIEQLPEQEKAKPENARQATHRMTLAGPNSGASTLTAQQIAMDLQALGYGVDKHGTMDKFQEEDEEEDG